MKFLTNLDLCKNELQNARIQNLTSHPSNPVLGQIYYNTIDNAFYGWNGSKWINLGLELNFHEYTSLIESADNDELVIYDVSDGLYKKITKQNLLAGIANNSQYVLIKKKEEFITTEGQTVFNLTQGSYETGTNRVDVYIWGVKQPPTAYTELSSTSIQLAEAVEAGTKVLIEYIQLANVMDYIHAENHKIGGSDPLSPTDIGAANEVHTHSISDITNLQTTLNNKVDTSEVTTTATANKILKLNSSGKLPASITGNADGNAATATKLQTARTISITGDATGSTTFDGSAKASINVTLSNSGVTAGTYTKVTADSKGRVTSGTTLSASDIPTLTSSKISDFDTQVRKSTLNQMAAPTADVSMNNKKITNVADPINPQDAATKNYVDTIKQGLDVKDSVRVATTSNLSATYSSGVLTASSNGAILIDGVTLALNDRVLVKNQSDAKRNGIYYVSQVGSSSFPWKLTRAHDADTSDKVTAGLYVWVTEGNTNADSGWILTTNDPITLDTSTLTFTQFSGAGMITAGTGLQKNGNIISLTNTGVTAGTYPKVTVDSQGRVTAGSSLSASDIPNLSWTKITSNKPTTLSGYGITDGVRNAGNTPSIQAGTDSSKPSAGTVGRIYIATDTSKIYRDTGSSWQVIGVVNWSDLSGKPSSSVANIDDAVNKRHTQNTDTTLTGSGANTINTTGTGNIVDFKVNGSRKSSIDNNGNFTGNAATASKLQTARTITLSGDVSGSASFNGSGNITINATVADDSHNHVISNIDNLQSTLDAKASVSHTHTSSKITDFNEATQDAIGAILTDTSTVDFTYDDTNNQIKADVKPNSSNQKVAVSKNSTTPTGTRKQINFKDGTNISVTVADNATNDAVDVTITNTYTHPTGDGNLHVPATGTTNNGKVLKAGSTAGSLSWGTLSKSDVGLGNVDNTADSAKSVLSAAKLTTPRTISLTGDVTGSVSFDGSANVSITATVADDSHNHVISNVDGLQAALDAKETPAGAQAKVDTHANRTDNPHGVTKSQVGLGSVSNYGIATQAEAEAGTSSAKYMTPLRTKQAIDALQAVKSVAGKTGTVTLTKGDVGLSNVDNTSDMDKPISTAVQTALDGKVDNSRVLTDVPANAKFTDTTYSEISEAEIDAGTSSTRRTITGRRVKYILDKVLAWISGLTKDDIGLGNVDNVKQTTKYTANIGNGSATEFTLTHNLGTKDIAVAIEEVATGEMVFTDVQKVDTNKIKLLFAQAPSNNQFRVTVVG